MHERRGRCSEQLNAALSAVCVAFSLRECSRYASARRIISQCDAETQAEREERLGDKVGANEVEHDDRSTGGRNMAVKLGGVRVGGEGNGAE